MNAEPRWQCEAIRATGHRLCLAPRSRLPYAVRWQRDLDEARLAMHLVLSVLDQPSEVAPRWWAIVPAEHRERNPCGFPPQRMKSHTTWPPGLERAEFAADAPTRPGARATRVVTTINDLAQPLSAVVYPTTIRWHLVLPAGIRNQLVR